MTPTIVGSSKSRLGARSRADGSRKMNVTFFDFPDVYLKDEVLFC